MKKPNPLRPSCALIDCDHAMNTDDYTSEIHYTSS